ncbi:beta-xylosidase/alpha-L-arabinofuranosidase 1-like isoform X2 [Mizuhopecten yessoensis]|uniref:beta-xylosidase/alpha-L-arabinofuranosidase 1-like isoform X2 n=1 Tax=Mizuhopecten yessoensis TaxID=6573 RepID=UPI000B45BF12|nr:beta-xylosidase/alpha-L-arabinofuranosidase 1-like isoform X2 [Mizuhopecten yessoensis]
MADVYCFSVFSLLSVCSMRVISADYPFRNTSLSYDERVRDLVNRLNVSELILQMSKGGGGNLGGPAPPIPRLGIGPFQWDSECLRGDVGAGNATSFPQSIGLAASFNPELLYEVSEATAVEVRAKYNSFRRNNHYTDHTGLNCFSPVINIMRHPLWGRNQETYGEDPYLSGLLAQAFVHGLQGQHSKYRHANVVCKHFAAYSGPENRPISRLRFDAEVKERDLRLTFLPQFEACVKAGAGGIMCSYNSVNGVPSCTNKKLLTDILRKEWGFEGFVVSDAGAVQFIMLDHMYYPDAMTTAVGCAEAGLNLELSPSGFIYRTQIFSYLFKALKMGLITKQLLVDRVKPLFMTRMRLGEFDPPAMNPDNKLNLSVIQSPEHRELAIKAATQSFVLLKNTKGFLPIRTQLTTIAIVGPMADNPSQLMGDYSPDVDPRFMTTPRRGLSPLAVKSLYIAGCNDIACDRYDQSGVKATVSEAEVTIVCLGTGKALETETMDRPDMSLPIGQIQLLKDAVHYGRGKVVLLLFSAGPVDVRFAQTSPEVVAIIQCFFPAQATGIALYNVLTFATPDSNPSGRLPYTWYSDMSQVFLWEPAVSLWLWPVLHSLQIQPADYLTSQGQGREECHSNIQCHQHWEIRRSRGFPGIHIVAEWD